MDLKYGDISPRLAAYSAVSMLKHAMPSLGLGAFAASILPVETIADFRALPPRERARRTIGVLKMLGDFDPYMKARELEDHEIFAALLINGAIR